MWATVLLTAVASQAVATNPVTPPPAASYPAPLTQPAATTPVVAQPQPAGVARSQSSGNDSVGFAAMAGQVIGDQYLLPDQPLFLPRATVVPQGFFVVETNYLNQSYDGEERDIEEFDFQTFNGVLRYGLNERLELRVAVTNENLSSQVVADNFFFDDFGFEVRETTVRGGVKLLLNNPEGAGPLFSILGEAGITQFEDSGDLLDDLFFFQNDPTFDGTFFNGRIVGLSQWAFGETVVGGAGLGVQINGDQTYDGTDIESVFAGENVYALFNAYLEKRFEKASTFVEVSTVAENITNLQVGALVPLGERFVVTGNVGYSLYDEGVEDGPDFEFDGVVWGLGVATAF